MPLTFCHPAAALPFSFLPKKYYSLTGLFVGSIVPDFEYFVRFSSTSYYTHTWSGLFFCDLPLGLVLCFLFHGVVRDRFIENLPASFLPRLTRCFHFDWNLQFRRKWLVICLCILAGGASHILWDQLTHETADNIIQGDHLLNSSPGLKAILVYYGWWGFNSATGLLFLALYFWKIPAQKRWKVRRPDNTYWPLVLMIVFLVFFVRLTINDNISFTDLVDTCIAGMIVGLVLVPIIQKAIRRKLRKHSTRPPLKSPAARRAANKDRWNAW